MKRRSDLILQMVTNQGNKNDEKGNEGLIVHSPSKTYHELQAVRPTTLGDIDITNIQSDESMSFIENIPERERKRVRTFIETPKVETITQSSITNIRNESSTSFQNIQVSKDPSPISSRSSSTTSSSSSTSSTSSRSASPTNVQHQNDNNSIVRARSIENYQISPINTGESDVDLSDHDPTYINSDRGNLNISSSSNSLSLRHASPSPTRPRSVQNTNETEVRKSRKRLRNPSNWKQNITKSLRNSGKQYISSSKTKKLIPARQTKDVCKCRLKWFENIQDTERTELFNYYWQMSNIDIQRAYIRSCMFEVKPKYKYSNAAKPRQYNNAFYFTINSNKIRVCKTFFINTLDVTDRLLRTVKKKTNSHGVVDVDMRGKRNSRQTVDPILVQDIKDHINNIPRIESHYLRAKTSREYISSAKTVSDLRKDFNLQQKEKNKSECGCWLYRDTFNNDFNIGFLQQKKDRCETCSAYELAPAETKLELKANYDNRLIEKTSMINILLI